MSNKSAVLVLSFFLAANTLCLSQAAIVKPLLKMAQSAGKSVIKSAATWVKGTPVIKPTSLSGVYHSPLPKATVSNVVTPMSQRIMAATPKYQPRFVVLPAPVRSKQQISWQPSPETVKFGAKSVKAAIKGYNRQKEEEKKRGYQ